MKKVLVSGSHFTVAQAVIEQLIKQPNIEVGYVGRKQTMEGHGVESVESKIIPSLGVQYYSLTTGRVSRSLSWEGLISFLKIPIGFWQAFWLIYRYRPDVVASFGGYVSVPVVVVAKAFGARIILHEQTLISGLSNRVCGMFADRIAVSFVDGNYDFDPKKVVLTGNPIRGELINNKVDGKVAEFLNTAATKSGKLIYITGGNQGAQSINKVVSEGLAELLTEAMVIWQTGDSKYGNYEHALKGVEKVNGEKKVLVQKWFEASEVGAIYKRADLVISRGGINTLNEIAFFNQQAIVVPYPYLYKDEQLVNARYFEKLGVCDVILQKDLNVPNLVEIVKLRLQKNKAEKKFQKNDAAEKVVNEVMALLQK